MAVYYFVYLLIGLSAVIIYGTRIKGMNRRTAICATCFILLFLLFALRHPSMGVDLGYGSSYGYLGRFKSISQLSWLEALTKKVINYERGYILFNKLISLVSSNQQWFLTCCALVSLLPVFYTIWKDSRAPVLSVIIYMGLPSFMMLYSGMRQAIAMGICFVAMLYIKHREMKKFLIAVVAASFFHSSALLFLFAYPIYNIPMNRSWRWGSLVCLPVFYVFRIPIFNILKLLVKENAVADNNGALMLFLMFALIYIFTIVFSGEDRETAGLKNLLFAACCIQAMGGVHNLVIRVGYFYMGSLVLLLPLLLHNMKHKQNAMIFRMLICVCFVAFGLYSLRRGSWSMSYPYYFFWE